MSTELVFPQPAFASIRTNLEIPQQLYKTLHSKQLIADAKRFLEVTPEIFCLAYSDMQAGIDNFAWVAIQDGAASTYTIISAVSSAASAGAGSLSGYAGIASAVSQLGLGSVTTTIAGLLGRVT